MSGVTDLARHIKARDNPSSYTPMFGRIISLPKLVIQLGNNILLDDSDIKSVFDIYETQERDNHTEYKYLGKEVVCCDRSNRIMKKTFDFDFGNGEFVMKDGNPVILSGINALKLWIQKCMRTQLYRYSIYKDKQYGANIEDLVIGKSYNFDFAESELRREIETALLRNEDIYSMSGFSAEKVGAILKISFTLNTAYGESAEVYTI